MTKDEARSSVMGAISMALKDTTLQQGFEIICKNLSELEKENAELKELVEKYRQAVDKCLHITFMGGGCEVNTIGQYATLVDGYLTDVEGLAKWKEDKRKMNKE